MNLQTLVAFKKKLIKPRLTSQLLFFRESPLQTVINFSLSQRIHLQLGLIIKIERKRVVNYISLVSIIHGVINLFLI